MVKIGLIIIKCAYNINLNEIVTVDDMVKYHRYTVRVHRYFCPVCNKRVIPCISDCISSYFKHADESPECEFYFGGGDYTSIGFQKLYFPDTVDVFKFIGFESFVFEDSKLAQELDLLGIPNNYHPNLHCGEFILWVKEMNELRDPSLSLNQLSESILSFSKYLQPVLFIINNNFEPEDSFPDPIIKKIINGSKGVVFEVPEQSSLSMRKVKIWLIDEENNIICPGLSSIEDLLKEAKFSYRSLKKIMNEFEGFFKEEEIEYTDPKHIYKPDSIELKVECKCGITHMLPIVMNLNDQIEIYWRHRNCTFRKLPFDKIQCLGCKSTFFNQRDAEKKWAQYQVDKKMQNRDYLKSLLEESHDINLYEELEHNRKVRILTGPNIGKIGWITAQKGDLVEIKVSESDDNCTVLKENVILL